MEKYTVTFFVGFTEFAFENGDDVSVFNETGKCFIHSETTEGEVQPIPLGEVLKRITNAEKIN